MQRELARIRLLDSTQPVRLRHDAGGVPQQSFNSSLAWCLPHSKLNTTLEKNLIAVNKLVDNATLSDAQRERALKRRDDVLRAIQERDAPTACA